MKGILLDEPILYKHASLRYFEAHEYHVTRFCSIDVIILVFDGILRFSENGVPYEIHPGEYFIQKHNCYQSAETESDSPAYLYVHFNANWSDEGRILPASGKFDCNEFLPLCNKIDELAHSGAPYINQCAVFYEILSKLGNEPERSTPVDRMASFMDENCSSALRLEDLCDRFHFSKNHIIHLFRDKYGMTPVAYLSRARIKKAQRLLEVTSRTAESIAFECGFCDYSHFYKTFRQISGVSPNQWRNNCRIRADSIR